MSINRDDAATSSSPARRLLDKPSAPCATCNHAREKKTAKLKVTVTEPTSRHGADEAGIKAAEDYMKAHPDTAYVDLDIRSAESNGRPWHTQGGWTLDRMRETATGPNKAPSRIPSFTVEVVSPGW